MSSDSATAASEPRRARRQRSGAGRRRVRRANEPHEGPWHPLRRMTLILRQHSHYVFRRTQAKYPASKTVIIVLGGWARCFLE